jgi:hypothetical protein
MEFRAWIQVDGVDIESDVAADLLDALAGRHGELGPVLGGVRGGVEVVLATNRDQAVEAAEEMYAAVADCLRSIGRPELFPAKIEIESVVDPVELAV